jgi:D-arabinitol 4-dehydrogenase
MTIASVNHETPNLHRTSYNRDDCKIGVVHIGYGAFHRAHQAIYFDDYMEKTKDLRWGIAAVNLRPEESASFKQSSMVEDGYIIKIIDVDGTVEYRKVRSHLDYVDWSSSPKQAEQLVANSNVHLVTITVTESGYYLDGNGDLDTSKNIISQEIKGEKARSIYGYLATALLSRMTKINQPISVLCCDNVRANGNMLERNFLSYLKALGNVELLEWVIRNVSFPCSMVDRITPRKNNDLASEVAHEFGNDNFDPIYAEFFNQWVVENKFLVPFPDLSVCNVQIVDDVDPYEEAKIRILNGGHSALAYLGALAGHGTFDEAMLNPILRQHFDKFEKQEVLPGLQMELPFDKHEYLQKITQRFCNSAIADQLERICMDGYSKIQLYIKPTLQSCLEQNINPTYSLDSIASWYVYARKYKSGTTTIPYHEPYWHLLSPLLAVGEELAFANNTHLWGDLPETYPAFAPALVEAIERMEKTWPA